MTVSRDLGMPCSSASASARGVTVSSSPTTIRVADEMRGRSGVASGRFSSASIAASIARGSQDSIIARTSAASSGGASAESSFGSI